MLRGFPLLVALALLGGCASQSRVPPSAPPAQVESASFAMNGRISVEHNGERHSAGLRWTHLAQSDEVLLLNPLGQTAARVFRDDGHATLDDGSKHYQDVDVESLMEQVLGWHLPLDGLHHWVLGIADPATPAQTERAEDGRISALYQGGWEIKYQRYEGTMPSRLLLTHEDLQVKLLIDEWDWSVK